MDPVVSEPSPPLPITAPSLKCEAAGSSGSNGIEGRNETLKSDDPVLENAPEAEFADQPPAKAKHEEAAADRRGFLHRLASFGLGEGPEHLLVPRTRLQPAETSETGD